MSMTPPFDTTVYGSNLPAPLVTRPAFFKSLRARANALPDRSASRLAQALSHMLWVAPASPSSSNTLYGGPFCQDTGEGHFKVGTAPFSRRLAGLCRLSLTRGAAAGAT